MHLPSASVPVSFYTGTSRSKLSAPVCTCHLAAIGNAYSTETVVWNSCDLASTSCPMVVVAVGVWVRHGVWVIGVQVITALWTLGRKKKELILIIQIRCHIDTVRKKNTLAECEQD